MKLLVVYLLTVILLYALLTYSIILLWLEQPHMIVRVKQQDSKPYNQILFHCTVGSWGFCGLDFSVELKIP